MTLQQFIDVLISDSLAKPVYCFVAKSAPVLFLAKIRNHLAKSQIQSIDLQNVQDDSLEGQLSITFLGQTQRFWLHGFHELDAKRKKKILSLVSAYQGPNQLFIALDAAKQEGHIEIIELPEKVNAKEWPALLALMNKDAESASPLLKKFFTLHQAAPLDSLMLLTEYGILLGARADDFLEDWLERILEPDLSLFMLSTYFFGKKPKQFFALWQALKDIYPTPFWTTYFSEQLFRAYGYCNYAKKADFTKAKKIGFRLPFSFIQKDWRQVKAEELIKAHQALYEADWLSKNSLHPYLERVFLEFMASK